MGYPSTHLKSYKRRLGLRERRIHGRRVHPAVMREVRRYLKQHPRLMEAGESELARVIGIVVAEVMRRLRGRFPKVKA